MNEGHFYADTGGESDDDEGAGWREPAITFRVEVMFLMTLDESMMIATAAAINIY
jgi:hypothetical protein